MRVLSLRLQRNFYRPESPPSPLADIIQFWMCEVARVVVRPLGFFEVLNGVVFINYLLSMGVLIVKL